MQTEYRSIRAMDHELDGDPTSCGTSTTTSRQEKKLIVRLCAGFTVAFAIFPWLLCLVQTVMDLLGSR